MGYAIFYKSLLIEVVGVCDSCVLIISYFDNVSELCKQNKNKTLTMCVVEKRSTKITWRL